MERDLMKQEAKRNVRMHGDHNNIFDRTIGGTISLKKPKVMDESNYNNDL